MAKKRVENKVLRDKELVTVTRACDTLVLKDRINGISREIAFKEIIIDREKTEIKELKEIKLALEQVLSENKKKVKKG